MKFKSYHDLYMGLEDLPKTWYPDLVRRMVLAAYRKKVFKPGGASLMIKMVENDKGLNKGEVPR